ncbi:MarR family winged helix-turn-helix transcriptional regulator [Pseudonocardia sp. GCM10023141]|uniref:MarR family winged helix-turn-helix transcriptional regulator n=1 Tax=Pseudonocardia sp. GCM10023141 TaxID=3252653 RepID=UPI0036186E90
MTAPAERVDLADGELSCTGLDRATLAGGDPELADHVGRELMRLVRVVTRLKGREDIAVAAVLTQLVDKGPLRVGEIAAAVGTDPSTVSRQVTALVEAGFAERRPDPDDGRAHRLVATEAGVDRCASGRRRRGELITSVLQGWPPEARRQVAQLLGQLADGMQEWDRRDDRRPGGEN